MKNDWHCWLSDSNSKNQNDMVSQDKGSIIGNGVTYRKDIVNGLSDHCEKSNGVFPLRRDGLCNHQSLSEGGALGDRRRDHRAVNSQREPECLSDDRNKTQLAVKANTAPQHIQYACSALRGIDEMDPVLGELDLISDQSAIAHLQARNEVYQEEQFCGHLEDHKQRSTSTSEDTTGGEVPGKPETSEAVNRKRYLRVVNWLQRIRQKELAKEQARAAVARECDTSRGIVDKPVLEDWEAKEESFEKESGRVSLSSWWSRCEGRRSESSTISQYVRSRCEASAVAQATALSMKQPRVASSVQRLERRL